MSLMGSLDAHGSDNMLQEPTVYPPPTPIAHGNDKMEGASL